MKTFFSPIFLVLVLCLMGQAPAHAQAQPPAPAPTSATPVTPRHQDARARALIDAAHAKLRSLRSLTVDMETNKAPSRQFSRDSEVSLERPNRFRVEAIIGAVVEQRLLGAVSNGQTVSTFKVDQHVAYEKPVRRENFFLGQNFLVQFFFDPQGIRFDPTNPLWGRPVSLFDVNVSAYDKETQIIYLGERRPGGRRCDVIEIKYNTRTNDIRQQIYIGDDKMIYQVDTYAESDIWSQKFSNYRINPSLPPATWTRTQMSKIPLVATDPARLGAPAPEFVLPGHNGGEFTLAQLMAGKKGMYVCAIDGTTGKIAGNADAVLPQMRILQEMKDKYEKQGLMVVAIVGGSAVTPDVKDEMMLNWMPNVTRFNYPILIDLDLERGIQGSAYQNFQVNGRNNLLLDAKGRVVFAANNFGEKVNQLALYQALAQIGFSVSAADLDSVAVN